MISNLIIILRRFLFFTLICLSLVFFHFGYQELKDIYFSTIIKMDGKKERYITEILKFMMNNFKE